MCRQGASVTQTAVLEQVDDPSLRAYVAWVSVLPRDGRSEAEEARSLVPDTRASHFWDGEGILARSFAPVLGLPGGYVAWDVYLVYPAGVRWEREPPSPLYWHHQLPGVTTAPRLDGESFAAHVRLALAKVLEERKND